MLRLGPRKYLVRLSRNAEGDEPMQRTERLFDLSSDPLEQRDLAAAQPAELAEIRERYAALLAEGRLADEARVAGVDDEDGPLAPQEAALQQQLRALGYVE